MGLEHTKPKSYFPLEFPQDNGIFGAQSAATGYNTQTTERSMINVAQPQFLGNAAVYGGIGRYTQPPGQLPHHRNWAMTQNFGGHSTFGAYPQTFGQANLNLSQPRHRPPITNQTPVTYYGNPGLFPQTRETAGDARSFHEHLREPPSVVFVGHSAFSNGSMPMNLLNSSSDPPPKARRGKLRSNNNPIATEKSLDVGGTKLADKYMHKRPLKGR